MPMTNGVVAYQHGIFPRSERVVAATRGLERGRTSREEVDLAFANDRAEVIRLQQETGLDFVSDGLLRWQDIFRPLVEICEGLDARTLVRWFDNNSFFRAPEPVGALRLLAPIPREMEDDADLPDPKMATLPSPYLLSRAAQWQGDRNSLMGDLCREVLVPVARELVARGYRLLHFQEPWLVYFGVEPGDWDELEKVMGLVRDATEGATIVFHTFFGDAGPHVDRLRALPVDVVGVDFVETDVESLGTGWEIGLLAGALDGRSSPVESVEGTVGFLRGVAEAVRPASLFLSSNCELEFLPSDVAAHKVRLLGAVAARLREGLA